MRYQLVEYEQASPKVREIYDQIRETMGTDDLPNWVKALGGSASLLRANWEKARGVLLEGSVPRLLKELIIFSVSTNNGARYCQACHAHAALNLDKTLSFDDLESMVRGEELDKLPKSFQTGIRLATKAALTPHEMEDSDFDELKAAGFSFGEIAELLAQGDLALMFNAITTSYQLEIDEEYQQYVLTA